MKKPVITLLTGLLMLTASAKGLSILDIKHSITDDNIIAPESFETKTRELQENFYLKHFATRAADAGMVPVKGNAAEYEELLSQLPAEIELPYNSIVGNYIDMYLVKRRDLVADMLALNNYYGNIFVEELIREKLPLELQYLPVIESALNPNAVSRAGACGLWQLMPTTATGLGLEVNSLVDQRRDPRLASRYAVRYLKQLYDIYGDWSLAIAAYNCGPGNVNKALRRAGEDKKKDFWEIYPYLPAETRGYVPCFIAANYAMNYYDKHNISPMLARRPILTDSVYVKKRVYFQQIADVLDIPIEEIRTLNPQYRQDVIPGDIKAYPLVLPSHQALCYIISEDSIVAHDAEKYTRRGVVEPATGASKVSDDGKYIITEEIKFHKVRKGDTFSKLAKRYGVTVASIKKANGIKTLRRGRTIKIVITKKTLKPEEPKEECTPTEIAATTAPEADVTSAVTEELAASVTNESAEPGDADNNEATPDDNPDDNMPENDIDVEDEAVETAVTVADETAATPDTVRVSDDSPEALEVRHRIQSTFNSRKPTAQQVEEEKEAAEVKPAEKTPVQQVRQNGSATQKPVYHKVKKGETLSKIARRYGTTVKKLQKLNGIDGSKLRVGQRIKVK